MPNLSDDKGKLFEILVGENIKGKLVHFREKEKDPETIKALIRNRIDSSEYEFIEYNSKQTATQIVNSITDQIEDVAWSSQPSDHHLFTGFKDENSDADLLIKTRTPNTYVGVSLKYGKLSSTTLRNLGFSGLGSIVNTSFEDIQTQYYEYREFLKEEYNIKTHEEYKIIRDSDQKTKKEINEGILRIQKALALQISEKLKHLSSKEIKQVIEKSVAPDTLYNHIRVKCKVTGNTANIIFQDVKYDAKERLKGYDSFIISSNNTVRSNIFDTNDKRIFSFNVKKNNGPLNGIVTTVTSKIME